MKWSHHPAHGFRFSATDGLAIVVCAGATIWGQNQIGSTAWFFPFVLGHFFLFCNVFRIPRKLELFWAGGFILIATLCLAADVSSLHAMWLVLPVTIGVLVYSIRLPGYHGVGAAARATDSQPSE